MADWKDAGNGSRESGHIVELPLFPELNARLLSIRELQRMEKYAEAMEIITKLAHEAVEPESFEELISKRKSETDWCAYDQRSGLGVIVGIGCKRIEKAHRGSRAAYDLRDEVLDTVVMWLCSGELLSARSSNLVSYLVNRISYVGDARDIEVRNTYGLHRVPVEVQAAGAVPGRKIHRQVFAWDLINSGDLSVTGGAGTGNPGITGGVALTGGTGGEAAAGAAGHMFRSVEEIIFGTGDADSEEGQVFAGAIAGCAMEHARRRGFDAEDIRAYAYDQSLGTANASDYGDAAGFCRYLSHPFYRNKLRRDIDKRLMEAGISEERIREFRRNTVSWTGKNGFKQVICSAIYMMSDSSAVRDMALQRDAGSTVRRRLCEN